MNAVTGQVFWNYEGRLRAFIAIHVYDDLRCVRVMETHSIVRVALLSVRLRGEKLLPLTLCVYIYIYICTYIHSIYIYI